MRAPFATVTIAAGVLLLAQCGSRSELGPGEPGAPAEAVSDAARPGSDACVPKTVTVVIPSTAPWTSTGINVVAGSHLVVLASGTVQYGGNADQVGDANGSDYPQKLYPAAVYPDTVVCTLIGKIGGTTAVDTGTPVPEGAAGRGAGFVGSSYDRVVTVSGPLFLGYNDQRDWFYDNVGSFTVKITTGC